MEEIANLSDVSTFQCTEEFLGPKRDHLYIVIPISVVYIIIFITGTIGNISTCIVISKNKAMHTATNYYLFSLAISDLLLLISGLPQEIYMIWSRYPYIFGYFFCFLRGLCAETSANATVLTITAFTIERYIAICHPFLSHTLSKLSRAVKFILVIWLVAIGLAIPQALELRIHEGEDGCSICQIVEPLTTHFFLVSTTVFFIAPMCLITILYILIGVRLKSSTMMKRRSSNSRMQRQHSKKVVKMLVAVVIAFFICWAPFHVQRLYTLYSTPNKNRMKIYEIVTYVSGVFYYISVTVNPILYNIMSVKFREAFKETFARCCGLGNLQNTPQRSYSALSRSQQRGAEFSDSMRENPTSHTTLVQKNSSEIFNGGAQFGNKTLRPIEESSGTTNSDSPVAYVVVTPSKINKFWQYFECLAKKTLDDGKRKSTYFPAVKENIVIELANIPKKPIIIENINEDKRIQTNEHSIY